MLIASLLSIWYCFNRAHLLQMAGDSVRQRQFLAGVRLLKRLLRLCGPFQADPAVSVRSFIKNALLQPWAYSLHLNFKLFFWSLFLMLVERLQLSSVEVGPGVFAV